MSEAFLLEKKMWTDAEAKNEFLENMVFELSDRLEKVTKESIRSKAKILSLEKEVEYYKKLVQDCGIKYNINWEPEIVEAENILSNSVTISHPSLSIDLRHDKVHREIHVITRAHNETPDNDVIVFKYYISDSVLLTPEARTNTLNYLHKKVLEEMVRHFKK